jgi:16S rRNA (adenine1518-N6/adenine1519-N6)-dimethyltransferase
LNLGLRTLIINMLSPTQIKELLTSHGLTPRKYMGQNFLVSQQVVEDILNVAVLKKTDIVLEIGPGLGVLTGEFAGRVKKVVAVEFDKGMYQAMKEFIAQASIENIELIHDDALKFKPEAFNLKDYKLISNLPYEITSPVLWKFLHQAESKPELAILMMQQEVAEKITALPGDMSLLAVLCQYYAQIEIVRLVAKENFWPVPRVDSVLVKLTLRRHKTPPETSPSQGEDIKAPLLTKEGVGGGQESFETQAFFKFVRRGFISPRKKLKNNLTGYQGLTQSNIKEVFEQIDLSTGVRAEDLSVENWIDVFGNL